MCAVSRKAKAKSLKKNTANGLASKILVGQVSQEVVIKYFKRFHIEKELNEVTLKKYAQQFHIHLTQDLRTHSEFTFESDLFLSRPPKEQTNPSILYYILGFEIIKMIFKMSWLQHERLYGLQKNQESFITTYIKPIQYTHKINGIIVPKDENIFFAKRSYFVKRPRIRDKKLNQLVMTTFTTDTITTLGFLIIRHLNFLVFDYDYIFSNEPESFFLL